MTPLDRYEYTKMRINLIPPEFIELYDLAPKVKYDAKGIGYVYKYMEIRCGMYGLPQSGMLSNKLSKKRLTDYGYDELPHTPGLFKHKTRPISFSLVVDDFGIKYIGKENALHLINALEDFYEVEVDWKGSLYCGITLDWHYEDKYVDISMPNYMQKQLLLCVITSTHHQNATNFARMNLTLSSTEKIRSSRPNSAIPIFGQSREEIHPASDRKFPILCTSH